MFVLWGTKLVEIAVKVCQCECRFFDGNKIVFVIFCLNIYFNIIKIPIVRIRHGQDQSTKSFKQKDMIQNDSRSGTFWYVTKSVNLRNAPIYEQDWDFLNLA